MSLHEKIAHLIDQLAEHERIEGEAVEFRQANGGWMDVETHLRHLLADEGVTS
jgi:hypothetical protein